MYMHIEIHVYKQKQWIKKGHELEGEMVRLYGMLWSNKQKGRNDVIELSRTY